MGVFSKDELEPPKWMDNEFLMTVLKSYETEEPLEITEAKFSPGSESADHFASILFRAKVNFKTASGSLERSLIIKTLPELDTYKGELLAQTKVFETEIGIYSKIIPKFEAELSKYGDNTKFAPKALYYSLSPKKIIIFEDLCTLDYNPIRDRFLNKEEVKEMLLLLAKWHAVSLKLAEEGDETVKGFDCGICNSDVIENSEFMTGGIKILIDLLETMDGYETYADKLKIIQKEMLKNCIKAFNVYKNGGTQSILALNHGDFHMKNAMFRFNKGKLDDVKLIDFQLSTYVPSVVDVIYCIYTMMSPELRLNYRDELIYFYFESYLATLKKIEFTGKAPTLADFNMDLIRHRDFEILVLSTFLPMWLNMMEPIECFEAEQIIKSTNHRAKLYRHPKYIKELQETLPRLMYKGYLDRGQQ